MSYWQRLRYNRGSKDFNIINRKEKAKWFIAGLATGLSPLLILAIILLVVFHRANHDDPFKGVKPDLGETSHVRDFLRPSVGFPTSMPLGETGFRAYAGPSRFQDETNEDWDYYSISVQKQFGKASYVFFQREFKMNEIPADLVDRKVQDIVTFDEKSRVVTFTLGNRNQTYKLPYR